MESNIYKKGDEFFSSGRRYVIISCIRSGRKTEVYRIERKSDKHPFLLKILKAKNMGSCEKIGQIPRVIKYLDASNVAQQLSIYDWGVVNEGNYFMISRYFTQGLLSDRLRQGKLKLNTAINIILDLAKTISSLQAYDSANMTVRPIRHGDLCPNNIMYDLDEKGEYKTYLIDIENISHIADDKHDAAQAISVMTIEHKYCAPEIFIDEPVYNSDVFSLGIILYECCFGEYPFPYDEVEYYDKLNEIGEDIHIGYLKSMMTAVPEYLKFNNCGGIAGLIIQLLKGMLEYDPLKRFSMNAVITHLNILRRILKVHDVELDSERCLDDEILATYKDVSNEFAELFTLSESRTRMEFEHDFYFQHGKQEFDILMKDLDLEEETEKNRNEEITNPELGYRSLVRKPAKNARGFKDIAGMEELKNTVKKKVLYFLENPELAAEYKINYPNGMLLYGPPGCGKTFFAEKFAEESGFSYALVKASDLGSTWIHGTQGKISELFKEAREKAPCVICFDEFDAFAPDRSQITNTHSAGEVNEFLSQLNNCGKDRIFIIATTNNPEGIDPAVLRSGRLEHKIYIPAPDFEARKTVLRMGVLSRPCTDGIDFDKLAEMTEGYVTSDLSLIVNDAAMNAAYARTFISQEMLETSIAGYRPSISEKVIKEHDEIRRRMESDKSTQNRIGFK